MCFATDASAALVVPLRPQLPLGSRGSSNGIEDLDRTLAV